VAAALAFVHFRETPPPERTLRYTIAAPENSAVHSFAISPDGRYVAIAAAVQGKRQLWLRALDALQSQPMPGTEDATYPFWSPDSKSVAFAVNDKLKRVDIAGGAPLTLCDEAGIGNGSVEGAWNRDGVILYGATDGLHRVSASGGAPGLLTKTDAAQQETGHGYPQFLPDGTHFLFDVLGELPGVYLDALDGVGVIANDQVGAVVDGQVPNHARVIGGDAVARALRR